MVGRIVNVINLGRMGFMAAYSIQRKCAEQILNNLSLGQANLAENVLLLVEHNPVYTTGIREERYTVQEEKNLRSKGAEFYRTNRGGLITYHGPGQLVAYPILKLKDFNLSMRMYVETLEKTMIQTCNYFDLDATTTENTGVWVSDRKIGAIGVHGRRYVTTHGVSLNCNVDLSWYKHIVPCGIEGKDVTSLSRELEQPVLIHDAVAPFLDAFQNQFHCQLGFGYLEDSDLALVNNGLPDSNRNEPRSDKKVSTRSRPMW